eukprot:768003-Hanusia_phi.AAC.2
MSPLPGLLRAEVRDEEEEEEGELQDAEDEDGEAFSRHEGDLVGQPQRLGQLRLLIQLGDELTVGYSPPLPLVQLLEALGRLLEGHHGLVRPPPLALEACEHQHEDVSTARATLGDVREGQQEVLETDFSSLQLAAAAEAADACQSRSGGGEEVHLLRDSLSRVALSQPVGEAEGVGAGAVALDVGEQVLQLDRGPQPAEHLLEDLEHERGRHLDRLHGRAEGNADHELV